MCSALPRAARLLLSAGRPADAVTALEQVVASCPRELAGALLGARRRAPRQGQPRRRRRRLGPPRPRAARFAGRAFGPREAQARGRPAPGTHGRGAREAGARPRHRTPRRRALGRGARGPARRSARLAARGRRRPRPREPGERSVRQVAHARGAGARRQDRRRLAARGAGRVPARARAGEAHAHPRGVRGCRRPLPGHDRGPRRPCSRSRTTTRRTRSTTRRCPGGGGSLAEYPQGRYVDRAAWRAAWGDYRAGRYDAAAQAFETSARLRPPSSSTPGLLYWAAARAWRSARTTARASCCRRRCSATSTPTTGCARRTRSPASAGAPRPAPALVAERHALRDAAARAAGDARPPAAAARSARRGRQRAAAAA